MPSKRCPWLNLKNPEYVRYHDEEWGRPVVSDRLLFENLILEGAQAGLSWETILMRRGDYREAFHNFDLEKVARMQEAELQNLLQNSNLIRHRLKIWSVPTNAQVVLDIINEVGSLCRYFWNYVDFQPLQPKLKALSDYPTSTPVSEAMAKDLRKRGMKFVGPTICYAYMQAIGLTNDHSLDCEFHREVRELSPVKCG